MIPRCIQCGREFRKGERVHVSTDKQFAVHENMCAEGEGVLLVQAKVGENCIHCKRKFWPAAWVYDFPDGLAHRFDCLKPLKDAPV